MLVKSAEKHPNADSLRIYHMEAPGYETIQIIANLDNIYQVGDVVAVALTDTILKDGTKIKPSKLRGIISFGMALGTFSAPIATDLSAQYCSPEAESTQVKLTSKSVAMQKWPSIERLPHVAHKLKDVEPTPKITYRGKIKLHGTNAGVQILPDGTVAAQKRSAVITPQKDNVGFATWVNQNIDYFTQLASEENLTIFGEWCGPGINKNTAISQIERKILAVFALQYGGLNGRLAKLEVRPEKIQALLPEHPDIFVLPYYGEAILLDFGHEKTLESAIAKINDMVNEVEQTDPWVKQTFAQEGIGEGLVFYPEAAGLVEKLSYSELLFKAKGEKHRNVKSKKAAAINEEIPINVSEFVEMFVTIPRLEQGVQEACDGEFQIEKIGQFLRWFAADVQKESVLEMAKAGVTWKQINKAVMQGARNWYLAKNEESILKDKQ